MNIVMLGYRGTGKSAVAKILSKKLRRRLYRIDDLIVQTAGESISEFVEQEGWSAFRKLESDIVSQVAGEAQSSVIDCGGGVVLDDGNMVSLKKEGRCVLLTAELSTIIQRIKKGRKRPALAEGLSFEEEQKKMLADRHDRYQSYADFIYDTTTCKPGKAAHEIIAFFRERGWLR